MTSGTIDIKPMTPYTIAIDIEVSVICLQTKNFIGSVLFAL